jgi:hypothetical protein
VVLLTAAGAGAILAGLLLWQPWVRAPRPPDPEPAAGETRHAPLQVTKLRVFRLEDKPTTLLRWELGADAFAARFKEMVKVEAKFSEPAYAFLLAFNPDGKEQLCWPAEPDRPPQRQERFDYPPEGFSYFHLTDGVGLQAFVLVASRQPLPAYDDWRARRPALEWRTFPAKAGVVWRGDGQSLDPVAPANAQRGVVVKREGVAELAELCRRLQQAPGVEALAVEAFAVLPEDGGK